MRKTVRRQCRYANEAGRCARPALAGWTTCARHKTAGISIRQWNRRKRRER